MLKPKDKSQPHEHKPRPYWHVDLKWIFGLIFALGLTTSGALYLAATLTSEKVAIPVATQIVAGLFSREGLDDAGAVEIFKQKALETPGDKVETLPGIYVTKVELQTLSPSELRLKIFSQLVTPYYELGAKGVAAQQSSDPAEQAKIEQQAGLLSLLNKDTHAKLQQSLYISLGLLIIPLIGLITFSAGFGRLVSPGIILVLATLPAAIIAPIYQIAIRSSKPLPGTEPTGNAASTGPIPGLSPESLQLIAGALLPGPVIIFAIGAALLLAAAIGKAISHKRNPKFHITEA